MLGPPSVTSALVPPAPRAGPGLVSSARGGGQTAAWRDAGTAPVARRESQGPTDGVDESSPWADIRRRLEWLLRQAPPWLVSLVFHALLLIVLALVTVSQDRPRPLTLTAGQSEYLGQQLEAFEAFSLSGIEEAIERDMAKAHTPVDDPIAAPPELPDVSLAGLLTTNSLEAPTIGTMLRGREVGSKEALLAAYGGTPGTEESVRLALEWLKRQQQADGSWRLNGPYPDGASDENRVAATALALLAFQGAGHTHQGGQYRAVVLRGSTALLKMQDKDGNFFHRGPRHHRLYSQAMATIAVCELYGMTHDPKLQDAAQLAIDYCVRIQSPEGGWRYEPRVDSDTSVSGWFAMALQSGLMSGLNVPSITLDNLRGYLDSAQVDDGSRYAYQPGGGPRLSMTAEALLCRQYLGWSRDDPRLRRGVAELLANPIRWERPNVYYWYYATQVLHHMGGKDWFAWNNIMREKLPERQVKQGPQAGSWDPTGDVYDRQGGRLYVTCLCTFMLEVYYRHLPIYGH